MGGERREKGTLSLALESTKPDHLLGLYGEKQTSILLKPRFPGVLSSFPCPNSQNRALREPFAGGAFQNLPCIPSVLKAPP